LDGTGEVTSQKAIHGFIAGETVWKRHRRIRANEREKQTDRDTREREREREKKVLHWEKGSPLVMYFVFR
jgi:hypothetical protein